MIKIKAVSLIAAGLALAIPAVVMSAPDLEKTRSNFKEWVEFKKLISEEKNTWRVEKETLNEQIRLLEDEIQKLADKIEETEATADKAQRERAELASQEEELVLASAVVKEAIPDLEASLFELVEYFPASLKDKTKILTERMPKTAKDARGVTLSNRILNVVGLLGEIEKFNNQVSMEKTMQNINGANVEVKTMYLGLTIAYYVDGTKQEAGVLKPAKGGWVKEPRNELAEQIAKAVAIYEKEAGTLAEFVELPLTVN